MNFLKRLSEKPRSFLFALSLFQILFVGLLDYVTGPQLAMSIFYLFPVLLAVLFMGRRGGVVISVAGALVWFIADILTPEAPQPVSTGIKIWNALVGLNFFLIITYLVSALRRAREKQSELIQFLVHDLRSPLGNVLMGLKAFQKAVTDLPETPRVLIEMAVTSGQWMLALINSLLDLSKMEEGKLTVAIKPVPAAELADQAIQQVALIAAHGKVPLRLDRSLGDVSVRADRELTIRVLVNLLGNAVKMTPQGKEVVLRFSEPDPGAVAHLKSCPPMVQFAVEDNGPGISEELAHKVFDKFFQVETGVRHGTGLGLTFCKMGVEAQKGRIWLESVPGQGTRVFVALPRTPESAATDVPGTNQG
ncbi:MAG TPA: HAMP domain-containing sensor histidine kinase [Candidatus Sumerlaeota bacterium]|nr:HAMP domain-containing sensor histidine kinase [Candidatus Sumerlaeota bacterium]HPS02510.1 HAMP domain-containing sensor histidine kinase [Candidatus Sumerlaeota bacterium]